MIPIRAVQWSPDGEAVRIIDQRRLPAEYVELDLRSADEVRDAIRTLAVRGAPAIGICAAMGLAAALAGHRDLPPEAFRVLLGKVALTIREARPTAVNLAWSIDRVLSRVATLAGDNETILGALRDEATRILDEDRRMCEAIGRYGATLLHDGARVLTHCNAGALATGGIGTALAPVYTSVQQGRRVLMLVGETRPLLQGSRLTAWELGRAGIPVTVLADSMVAAAMRAQTIDLCLVGADRIAVNGDVANKIGTYSLAVLARYHGIPFYVAAPSSTLDPMTASGEDIVIEQRHAEELTVPFGVRIAPERAMVQNPAFDVTPADLVSAFITDRGIVHPPYLFS